MKCKEKASLSPAKTQHGDKKVSTSDAMLAAAKSLVEGITGRKMSPKSAKKNPTLRMSSKTPEKSGKRDENSPPSNAKAATPIKDSADAGVFPLDHVEVLSEKLDPGGNINSVIATTPIKSVSRKRKLDDEIVMEPSSILVSPRALRMRTPSKSVTPKKLTFHPSVVDSPFKRTCDSPMAKKRKLSSSTPTKAESNESHSPRVLRSRTPQEPTVELQFSNVTPKKTRCSPLKFSLGEKICTTPNKFQELDVVKLLPSKMLEPLEAADEMSSGMSPIKQFSTPSKHPRRLKKMEPCVNDPPSSRCQTEIKPTVVSPRILRTRTPTRSSPILESSQTKNTPKKVLFAPIEEETPSSSKATNQRKLEFKADDSVDPPPPVLHPEAKTVRRSSRTSSVDLPPPVLEMEISTSSSPPPLSLER